ncbi:hypothetical protein MAR_019990 [Mya arenaria]|uniref:Uncharacterized protein n=1 Tax=Mya arenaria TaxID=6604 RepID=A0ABY7E7U2_MYAAR|nr:hypothetical protein MAR_019990 [Mya arenaria]
MKAPHLLNRDAFFDLTYADATASYGYDEIESLSTHYSMPVNGLLNERNSFLEEVRTAGPQPSATDCLIFRKM